jgi:RNA recognition motif-containing protein
MKNIYVGNLSFSTTEQSIRDLFEPFGQLQRVALMMDRATGRSRGFAFVAMADDEEAAQAIAELNCCTVGGREHRVNDAGRRAARAGH